MKFRVAEVEVEHLPRRGGTQSLKGLLKWVRVSSKCAAQMLSMRLAYRPRKGGGETDLATEERA